jgi:hypothetical protein
MQQESFEHLEILSSKANLSKKSNNFLAKNNNLSHTLLTLASHKCAAAQWLRTTGLK